MPYNLYSDSSKFFVWVHRLRGNRTSGTWPIRGGGCYTSYLDCNSGRRPNDNAEAS